MIKRFGSTLSVLCLAFGIAVGTQAARGTFDSSFADFPDEPAHVVTGLMFRDYISKPDPLHPIRYAKRYYDHYPKVAIGQWPPIFYGMQGVWSLLFGAHPTSIVLLMTFLTALCATMIFEALRSTTGILVATACSALFVALPLIQRLGGAVMTEVPVAMWSTCAVLSFSRYLEAERSRWSVAFGLFSTLAILTKGVALALALVPLAGIALSGQLYLIRRGSFWWPAAIVGAVCGPWYAYSLGIVQGSWSGEVGAAYFQEAFLFFASDAWTEIGAALLAGAVLGAVAPSVRRHTRALHASLLAFMMGVALVLLIVPASTETRHLTIVLPALVILFGLGLGAIRLAFGPRAAALTTAATVIVFAVQVLRFFPKDVRGYREATHAVLSAPELARSRILIASGSVGEGAFVSEVALHEKRPNHQVLRATKVLATSSWLGDAYQSRFSSQNELRSFLRAVPVGVVVFDGSAPSRESGLHQEMLEEAIRNAPALWTQTATFTITRHGRKYPNALRVFVMRGHQDQPPRAIDAQGNCPTCVATDTAHQL